MANKDKNRKTEAQDIYDQAENAGRFPGNDKDAKAAREQAVENIREDAGNDRQGQSRREGGTDTNDETTDREAHRSPQAHDYKGEAQNVNDDTGRPLTSGEELKHARNKAAEGMRQDRDDWSREQKTK